MPLTAPVSKGDFKIIDPGSYVARCYMVVDLGTHSEDYQGTISDKRKIRVVWELPTELHEFEKDGVKKEAPVVIGKEYTLSMGGKANLRKDVEKMIGTTLTDDEAGAFDVFSLVGMDSMIQIANKESKQGKTYALVQAIMKVPKGMVCPDAVNAPVTFNTAEWNQGVFESLPKFIQEKINQSHERRDIVDTGKEEEINPDEIPF